jgi:hypothetical protein
MSQAVGELTIKEINIASKITYWFSHLERLGEGRFSVSCAGTED